MRTQAWLTHKIQQCMFKCVKNWRWSWQLVSLISVPVGRNTQNTGRQTASPEWKKKSHYSLSCCPHFPPRHSTTDVMAKERASRWSVRMIHCQFTGLFIKPALCSSRVDGTSLLTPSCNLHIDTYDGAALIGHDCEEMTSSQTLIWLNMVSEGDNWSDPVGFVQTMLWHVLWVWAVLCDRAVFF